MHKIYANRYGTVWITQRVVNDQAIIISQSCAEQNSVTAGNRMKFPTKLRNIFHHTLAMFSHYLGKFNTTTPQHTGHANVRLLEQATPAFIPTDLWPANSPPVDYIWSVVQQRVYQSRVHDTDELKQRLQQLWRNIDHSITYNAIDEWRKRLRSCMQANGEHFEHIL